MGMGSRSSRPLARHHSGNVWPFVGTYTLVANPNDFRLMPSGMSRQNFMGGPKMRKSVPCAPSWAPIDRPDGPEPTMATSVSWVTMALYIAPRHRREALVAPRRRAEGRAQMQHR